MLQGRTEAKSHTQQVSSTRRVATLSDKFWLMRPMKTTKRSLKKKQRKNLRKSLLASKNPAVKSLWRTSQPRKVKST